MAIMKKLPLYEIFRSLPISRILFSCILGIFLERSLSIEWINFFPAIWLIWSGLIILLIFNWLVFLHLEWIRGFFLTILIVLVFAVYSNKIQSEIYELQESWYLAEAVSFPTQKASSTKLKVRLLNQLDSVPLSLPKNKMICYFKSGDSLILQIRPGDQILFKTRPELVRNQGNPYEFDYASYLRSKGVYYTGFVEESKHILTKKHETGLRFSPLYLQKFIMDRILLYSYNEKSAAVLLAICLGSKDFLERDLKNAYANAGGIHVMAVSGLHVGLIWLFLGYMFSFMGKGRRAELLRAVLSIFILWIYAFMTGLSPSVTRSALMFSLINFGKILNRQSSVYNSLMVAAFFQISFKPDSLFDPGFQFSYLAVFSIIYFHPLIRSIFPEGNIITNKIIDLASVSIAAQILTFPLAIFYFNQFPIYFLLTNYILIPLVTILMTLFISSCLFIGIPLIYKPLIIIMNHITGLMNFSMLHINSLPGAVIKDIYINEVQLKLLLLIILLFIYFREYKQFKSFLTIHLLVIIFFGLRFYSKITAVQNDELIVYNSGKIPCIGLHLKNGNYILTTELSVEDSLTIFYATDNNRIRNFRKPPTILKADSLYQNLSDEVCQIVLPDGNNFLWKTKFISFLLINNMKSFKDLKFVNNLSMDLIIIADPTLFSFFSTDSALSMRQWVISSSVPWYVKPDSTWILNHPILHDVRFSAAYIYK
jgi:competence protein ComEC